MKIKSENRLLNLVEAFLRARAREVDLKNQRVTLRFGVFNVFDPRAD